jgi:NAD+ synthase (glutamine-hydrolysing)
MSSVGDMRAMRKRSSPRRARAYEQGARLVLTPELSICGYPPKTCCCGPRSSLPAMMP